MIRNWHMTAAAVALTAALGTGPLWATEPVVTAPAAAAEPNAAVPEVAPQTGQPTTDAKPAVPAADAQPAQPTAEAKPAEPAPLPTAESKPAEPAPLPTAESKPAEPPADGQAVPPAAEAKPAEPAPLPTAESKPAEPPADTQAAQPSEGDKSAETAEAEQDKAIDPIVEAQGRLAVELAATLASEPGAKARNQIVSPLTLSSSLSLLYIGAQNEVKTLMDQTLGFADQGFSKFRALSKELNESPEVSVATNLWFDTDAKPIQSGLIALKHEFGLEPHPIDFGSKEAVTEINHWVEKETQGTIRNVIDRLSKDTEFVAASALHFKGTWLYTFDKANTKPKTFHSAAGKPQEVPFMSRTDKGISTLDADGYQGVDLPYKDDRYGLVALLPPEGTKNLHAVLAKKSDADVGKLLDRLRGKGFSPSFDGVTVELPRFTLQSSCNCLPVVKRALGMEGKRGHKTKASALPRLIFPGLTDSEISDIRVASMLTVDEEGTVASDATVVTTSRGLSDNATLTFDRPFLLALREKKTGMILFLALVQDLGDQQTAAN